MKEIARFCYGSQNYGLDGPDSDKDYKVIMRPSWDDLYTKREVSLSDMDFSYDHEHYSAMDCRQFDSLLHKCNPNILEMVYSTDINYNNTDMYNYIICAKDLLSKGYIALHWKEFYAASQGLALNALNRYGATPKAVSRSWYISQLVEDVALHDFHMGVFTWRDNWYSTNARKIRYETDKLSELDLLLTSRYIKDRFTYNKGTLENEAKNWIDTHQHEVENLYTAAAQLTNIMKELVLNELKEELHFEFV